MGKTVFVDGDPSIGLAGTIVTAAFLNALHNHRHTGEDVDGAGAIDYAPDIGAADAYAADLVPALTVLVVGLPISFMVANINTGPVTFQANATAAKPVKKNYNQPLEAGDFRVGQIVTVIYDGINYQMISQLGNIALPEPGIKGTHKGLVMANNATTPDSEVDIDIDSIMLEDAGGNPLKLDDIDLTVDMARDGANGLDTGAEAANTFYHVHLAGKTDDTSTGANDSVVANKLADSGADFITEGVVVGEVVFNITDSTWAKVTAIDSLEQLALDADIFTGAGKNYVVGPKAVALLSVSATAPTMPTGYTYSAFIGSVRNDGTSDFIAFEQEGNKVFYDAAQTIINGGAATSAWTGIDVTALFPPTAKMVFGIGGVSNTGIFGYSPRSDGHAGMLRSSAITGTPSTFGGVLPTSRTAVSNFNVRYEGTMYYYTADANLTLVAQGWEY